MSPAHHTSLFRQLLSPKKALIESGFSNAPRHLASCNGIKVLFTPHVHSHAPLFAVIPTRAIKPAVKRNKLRRQVKHILWEQHKKQRHRSGLYLIILYQHALGLSYETVATFLARLSRS